jgi:hypothetical protein
MATLVPGLTRVLHKTRVLPPIHVGHQTRVAQVIPVPPPTRVRLKTHVLQRIPVRLIILVVQWGSKLQLNLWCLFCRY